MIRALRSLARVDWDYSRGTFDGKATFWSKKLLGVRGYSVELHKFVGADGPGCFHTHPATALRIILLGGYVEELEDGTVIAWRAGDFGRVYPATSHRVMAVLGCGPAYTLWIRGPKTHEMRLRGAGWLSQRDHMTEADLERLDEINTPAVCPAGASKDVPSLGSVSGRA